MKKILILISLMVLVSGCGSESGNYTWTPTADEWANMTPAERNAWTANEMRVRQNQAELLHDAFQRMQERQLERERMDRESLNSFYQRLQ